MTSLYDEIERDFAAATLKASTDYLVWKDRGIIQLYTDAVLGTIYSRAIGNIKLIYAAGYDQFNIITDKNDRLDFEETADSELTAQITAGVYTASELAAEIDTALEAVGESAYTITYDIVNSKFTLTSDLAGGGSKFILLTNTGTNVYQSIVRTLELNTESAKTTSASETTN